MNLNLKGKRVLVTGGSRGIGRSIADELLKEGCVVDICSRTEDIIIDVLKDDLNKIDGQYDILINNVGGGGRWGSEEYEQFEEWEEVYEKNAGVARKLTMKCIPYMRDKKWGRVITISSIFGKEAGGMPWFNMAKSAQTSLMKTLAMNPELSRSGITFNSVAPGAIMIPDTGWDNKNEMKQKIVQLPLGRMGTPEEVAAVVAFICSERASLINGASIAVDGAESRSF